VVATLFLFKFELKATLERLNVISGAIVFPFLSFRKPSFCMDAHFSELAYTV